MINLKLFRNIQRLFSAVADEWHIPFNQCFVVVVFFLLNFTCIYVNGSLA